MDDEELRPVPDKIRVAVIEYLTKERNELRDALKDVLTVLDRLFCVDHVITEWDITHEERQNIIDATYLHDHTPPANRTIRAK